MSAVASAEKSKTNPHVFLLDGEAAGAPGLRGARCRSCGKFTLGRVPCCSHCFSRQVEEVAAGQRATLVEHSVARHPAGGFAAPYAIGQVKTSEGLILFAPLVGEVEGLQPGRELEFRLIEREDGSVGFAYASRTTGAAQ